MRCAPAFRGPPAIVGKNHPQHRGVRISRRRGSRPKDA